MFKYQFRNHILEAIKETASKILGLLLDANLSSSQLLRLECIPFPLGTLSNSVFGQ